MRVKQLDKDVSSDILKDFPSFSTTESIKGMKDKFYGKNALLVRSEGYIYNVTSAPYIYHDIAH